jgi:hypothetical protein
MLEAHRKTCLFAKILEDSRVQPGMRNLQRHAAAQNGVERLVDSRKRTIRNPLLDAILAQTLAHFQKLWFEQRSRSSRLPEANIRSRRKSGKGKHHRTRIFMVSG